MEAMDERGARDYALRVLEAADPRLTGIAATLKVLGDYDRERIEEEPYALLLLAEQVERACYELSRAAEALRGHAV